MLLADIDVTGITADRVLDFDYRASGWNTAPVEVFDQDGLIMPTIVVDDNGATTPMFGRMVDGEHNSIYIWAFSVRSYGGHQEVHALMDAAKRVLQYWQDPVTRGITMFNGRTGMVTADDGVLDRMEFRVSGIPPL